MNCAELLVIRPSSNGRDSDCSGCMCMPRPGDHLQTVICNVSRYSVPSICMWTRALDGVLHRTLLIWMANSAWRTHTTSMVVLYSAAVAYTQRDDNQLRSTAAVPQASGKPAAAAAQARYRNTAERRSGITAGKHISYETTHDSHAGGRL